MTEAQGVAFLQYAMQDRANEATAGKRRVYLPADARDHCSARLQQSAAELTGKTRIVAPKQGAAMLLRSDHLLALPFEGFCQLSSLQNKETFRPAACCNETT